MAVRRYETKVEVNAPRERVWHILAAVEAWPSWTPTMTSVRPRGGAGVRVGDVFDVKQPKLPASVFTVDVWNEGESFVWSSSSTGVRTVADHVVVGLDANRSSVTLSIQMEGPVVPLLWVLAGRTVRRYVDTEAASLKAAAERRID